MERKDLGKEVHNLSNCIKRKIDRKVGAYGLTSVQSRTLYFIKKRAMLENRPVYQKEIEEAFDIRRSSVTSLLQLLEKNEYIKREAAECDARLKQIVLTEKGDKVTNRVHELIMEEEDKMLNSITEEERKLFFELLEKLSHAIGESETGGKL